MLNQPRYGPDTWDGDTIILYGMVRLTVRSGFATGETTRGTHTKTRSDRITQQPHSDHSAATGMNAFEILIDDIGKEMLTTLYVGIYELRNVNKTLNRIDNKQDTMNNTLNRMDNTQNEMKDTMHEMNQKQNSSLYLQEDANATLKSIDHKMDASLSNDEKMLSGMQNSGPLRVPK